VASEGDPCVAEYVQSQRLVAGPPSFDCFGVDVRALGHSIDSHADKPSLHQQLSSHVQDCLSPWSLAATHRAGPWITNRLVARKRTGGPPARRDLVDVGGYDGLGANAPAHLMGGGAMGAGWEHSSPRVPLSRSVGSAHAHPAGVGAHPGRVLVRAAGPGSGKIGSGHGWARRGGDRRRCSRLREATARWPRQLRAIEQSSLPWRAVHRPQVPLGTGDLSSPGPCDFD
jgi:hypothetical protein